jgi:UDP-3-O-[3-hydroxymyristoyl] glucosamine N-acyltransferase
VILAGQAGVSNHIEIGDRARVGPKTGVFHSVPAGATVSGAFSFPHKDWLRISPMLARLPKLWTAVRTLERKVAGLPRRLEKGDKDHA